MTTVITGVEAGRVQGKNLSTKYVGINPDTFEIEVVVDEKTIKHDGSSYYVDTAELDVVSSDRGNLIVEGSDSGAFLEVGAINEIIGNELGKAVAGNGDNLEIVNGMLTTVFKDVSEVDGDSIDFSMSNNAGNWTLTGEVIASADEGNLVEVRETGVFAEMPNGAVTYDSTTGQLMANGVAINNTIVTAPDPVIGTMFTNAFTYVTAETASTTELLDIVPEGKYIGHVRVRRMATTETQMYDTFVKLTSNGGTEVSGFDAIVGQITPATPENKDSASSIFSVKSNGVDPVKLKVDGGPIARFKGYIYCTLIRVA